jgi:malate dehydrogenase (oxaloacetate-decarboxylating)(NADP+)
MSEDRTSGKRGFDILRDPYLNKDTAFTERERLNLRLKGLVPVGVETLEQQTNRCLEQLESCEDEMAKYVYLQSLQERNRILFYKVLMSDPRGMMPIVYTPTVGRACLEFGHIYRKAKGLYITDLDRGHVAEILRNWGHADIRFIVVTDGGRILGLGDQGSNGMGIPIGKLALYTACAGIPPSSTLPIMLDVGTNNEALLADDTYLGQRKHRVTGEAYVSLVDEFMEAVQEVFPGCCVQFEDFAGANAVEFLDRYQDKYCMYNDDIQGTAAVGVAGILGAIRVKEEPLRAQSILFAGAGAAATGIASLIEEAMVHEGASRDEARSRIWMFDIDGLLTSSRKGLNAYQQRYAHKSTGAKTFLESVKAVKPTAIIGVSTVAKLFDREVIEEMSRNNERPVIFPYSNPTSHAECSAEEAITWSKGTAIFASGSPFKPVDYNGKTYVPGQGNNVYIFPAMGLAVLATQARRVTEEMFLRAAHAVADQVTPQNLDEGLIYPPISEILETSIRTAVKLAEIIYDRDLAAAPRPKDVEEHVRSLVFNPEYKPLI